jgi:hypothetical protein
MANVLDGLFGFAAGKTQLTVAQKAGMLSFFRGFDGSAKGAHFMGLKA